MVLFVQRETLPTREFIQGSVQHGDEPFRPVRMIQPARQRHNASGAMIHNVSKRAVGLAEIREGIKRSTTTNDERAKIWCFRKEYGPDRLFLMRVSVLARPR
jgi:hypothetical protein